jgi:hypothetical protein
MVIGARLAVGAGFVLVAFTGWLARRIAAMDVQLKAYEKEKAPFSRWATESWGSYRPDGWPLLTRLRIWLAVAYLSAFVAMALLMYGCPDIT